MHSGHCLCGQLRFEADREPQWVSYCHCTSLPATLYGDLLEQLECDGAFEFPDDGIATFNAARRQHRFMEE